MVHYLTTVMYKGYTIRFIKKDGQVIAFDGTEPIKSQFVGQGMWKASALDDVKDQINSSIKNKNINQYDKKYSKRYNINTSQIGKVKYSINFHNGEKHNDGSEFWGIYTFKNKKDMLIKEKELISNGYKFVYK